MHDAGYMTRKKQSYKDIEIYTIAKELAVKVHRITLEELPKFEMSDDRVS
jgi:hypothetical protein